MNVADDAGTIPQVDHGPQWIALDVGGANVKAAHVSGAARSFPFEVWKHPEDLSGAIARLASSFPPFSHIALTMTAELCDCFATKSIGVKAIVDSVIRACPEREIAIWCVDRAFHSVSEVRERPLLAAAANWLALATLWAEMFPMSRGLLIDIGTTTTDIVPFERGRAVPLGWTDTDRLRSGELVYAGIRRTPVCALAPELEFRGGPTGLAAELFATTLDVYLTLGDIEPDPNDLSTADGGPATIEAARTRLARMVGADRDGFTPEDAWNLASKADECLVKRLSRSVSKVCAATIGEPDRVIISGSGEFLARRLAEALPGPSRDAITSVKESWGPVNSSAACARALLLLASGQRPGSGQSGGGR